ncbi:hypothetical protein M378DRAFT_813232 [Amanita muscaria Koide BX008]|uniref:Uncharacterized protein n=1 Tax=Amanita muscaria (strain Koide BX008) TaxID=946122 RepID=A0A0C2SFM6_AMAMK|nr:hypothetical protein M378DRAFT_813232 [Amanita muscaria Koide BX008]
MNHDPLGFHFCILTRHCLAGHHCINARHIARPIPSVEYLELNQNLNPRETCSLAWHSLAEKQDVRYFVNEHVKT